MSSEGSRVVAGQLSERVPAEFRALMDEFEPWLESLPMRDWNQFVVYATDAEPEFKRGATGQRFHCIVLPKERAIADEEAYDTDAGRELARLFRKEQRPNQVWVVLSSAQNNIHVLECSVIGLTAPAGEA